MTQDYDSDAAEAAATISDEMRRAGAIELQDALDAEAWSVEEMAVRVYLAMRRLEA